MMHKQGLIRPAFTPATIALTIGGFMVFWPLGAAMLGYILWGEKLNEFKDNVNRATSRFGFGNFARGATSGLRTGNVAFDDWREAELKRLDDERRKLEELHQEFDEYVRELRRAKDSQEFDAFMQARRNRQHNQTGGQTQDQTAGQSGAQRSESWQRGRESGQGGASIFDR